MKRTAKLLGLFLVIAMVVSCIAILAACDDAEQSGYTVTFYDGESVLKTETVKEGEKVFDWTPVKDGYNFEGWYATPQLQPQV